MKSEKAIRDHIRTLQFALKEPCDCGKNAHRNGCEEGGMIINAVIEYLKWVLEENDRVDRQVEDMAREVGKRRDSKDSR